MKRCSTSSRTRRETSRCSCRSDRHNLCDAEVRHYCNELVVQAGIPTELFLTRKLWDAGNSGPYGHRGDLTTLTGAIAAHGGEARESRLAFDALPQGKRDEVIEFLKSLQMLPPGTPSRIVDSSYRPMNPAGGKASTFRH
jgi:hypothetical protein